MTITYLGPAPDPEPVECAGRISWLWDATRRPMAEGTLTLPLGSTLLWAAYADSVTAHPQLFTQGARVMVTGHWLGSPGSHLYLTGIRPLTHDEWDRLTHARTDCGHR